ncbi:NADH-quinone oxidoreductase subunit N [Bryobacter aggregatus]|uniref:NADH-quinone oxidoreductase subunit N n=1 Tax=Bryobacter aggregatus TaxID=360054 RepID=UPI0004E1474A|nr:NADH-quinone oxidoreductase subunit N [Bryobacter aggregatus]
MMPVSINDLFTIMPALVLALFGCSLFLMRLDSPRVYPAFLVVGEILAAISLWRQNGFTSLTGFQGSVVIDSFGIYMNAICLVGTVLAAIGASRYLEAREEDHPEFYGLMMLAQSGMYLMNAGTELVTVFIGLEITAVSFYILTGFLRREPRSNEAALKYLLLGAFSSGLLLYGFSVLYGLTGSTRYLTMTAQLGTRLPTDPLILLAVIPIVLGLLFKVAAAPMHMWAPDAYDGAPTPVTAFLATASKVASFGLLLRLLLGPLHPFRPSWEGVILFAALASLTIGNLAAITQSSAKRLLAYSSIGHAGYLLLGLVAGNQTGIEGMLLYLLVYTLMTTGAFLVLAAMEREGVEDFRGLLYSHPAIAMLMVILLLSLAGLPPTAGFFAKYMIFLSLVQTRQYAVAIVAALYVAVSLYYYFRIVREMTQKPREQVGPTIAISLGWRAAVGVAAILSLGLGLNPEPALSWAREALR